MKQNKKKMHLISVYVHLAVKCFGLIEVGSVYNVHVSFFFSFFVVVVSMMFLNAERTSHRCFGFAVGFIFFFSSLLSFALAQRISRFYKISFDVCIF